MKGTIPIAFWRVARNEFEKCGINLPEYESLPDNAKQAWVNTVDTVYETARYTESLANALRLTK